MADLDQKVRYSHIAAACQLIALDNGGINRDRSVEKQERDFDRWISRQDLPNLPEIDRWLGSLSADDLETVCVGGQDEPETIAAKAKAPPFMEDLLNAYFDEVC